MIRHRLRQLRSVVEGTHARLTPLDLVQVEEGEGEPPLQQPSPHRRVSVIQHLQQAAAVLRQRSHDLQISPSKVVQPDEVVLLDQVKGRHVTQLRVLRRL